MFAQNILNESHAGLVSFAFFHFLSQLKVLLPF